MTIFIQYDPLTADANNHVYFSSVTIPNGGHVGLSAPHPPQGILQRIYPDGTDIIGKVLDLSQVPPVIIPDPGNGP